MWESNYAYINGNCHYYETTRLSYDGAIRNCKKIFGDQGKLFEPREEDTYDKVMANAKGDIYWIGINDRVIEGDFRYVSGGNLEFENWASGTIIS